MGHTLVATQHWASDGEHAIILTCTTCDEQTFVGFGDDAVRAEAAARSEHEEWLRTGSPSSAGGVARLYERYGFSLGRQTV